MFHTFAALPSACAAADEVLEHHRRESSWSARARDARARGSRRGCTTGWASIRNVAEIRGRGLLQAVEIVARPRHAWSRSTRPSGSPHRIVGQGLNHGVFFYPGGTGVVRDIICLGPPLISTDAEIDQMADVLETSIDEVLA